MTITPVEAHVYARFPNPWDHSDKVPISLSNLPILIAAVLVESLIYGIHIVLFVCCSFVLLKKRTGLQIAMSVATGVMFILATADIAVSWHIIFRHLGEFLDSDSIFLLKKAFPKFWLHLVNKILCVEAVLTAPLSFIADATMIARTYIIWEHNKVLTISFGLTLIVGTMFGIISEGTTSVFLKKFVSVYLIMIFGLNVILTLLMAGKIWWITREIRRILGCKTTNQYIIATAIIIESGILYSASIILVLILSPTRYIVVAACISIRVVCITPILIIVQVALGNATHDLPSTLSKERGPNGTVVLDTVTSDLIFRTSEAVNQFSIHDVEEVELAEIRNPAISDFALATYKSGNDDTIVDTEDKPLQLDA